MSDVARTASWRTNFALFLATVASVFVTGVVMNDTSADAQASLWKSIASAFSNGAALRNGAAFTGSLLTILVAHELGHYVAARIHKVDASLPYFLPMPLLSPFGTMGAVIRMRGTIATRKALFDIGAAGPLAGLAFAIPLYAWGVSHSRVVDAMALGDGSMQLGESILLKLLDRLFAPAVPEGHDLLLSPVAFGAWGGFFVTMINLLPIGQLDGGHVAYALFGPRQNRYAPIVHRSLVVFFFVVVAGHTLRDVRAGIGLSHLGRHLANGMFWLVWSQVLAILGTIATRSKDVDPDPTAMTIRTRIVATLGLLVVASIARDSASPLPTATFFGALALLFAMESRGGTLRKHALFDHPSTSDAPLDRPRAILAIVTLAFFVLLFMPEPLGM